jgi:hypothetical protein
MRSLAASLLMSQGTLCNVTEPETSGYEVGGGKSLCAVHPMKFWAFDLSGIVAFAGTQYDSLTPDRRCRLTASSVTVSHRHRRLRAKGYSRLQRKDGSHAW